LLRSSNNTLVQRADGGMSRQSATEGLSCAHVEKAEKARRLSGGTYMFSVHEHSNPATALKPV
jgi:hypothetical protein